MELEEDEDLLVIQARDPDAVLEEEEPRRPSLRAKKEQRKPAFLAPNFRERVVSFLSHHKNPVNLEKMIFNAAIHLAKKKGIVPTPKSAEFMGLYADIAYNLRDDPGVAQRLKADQVEWMDPIFEQFRLKRMAEETIAVSSAAEVTEGMYTCGKCGCKKIRSFCLQMRSGDEGMTNIFACTKCQAMWKQNN